MGIEVKVTAESVKASLSTDEIVMGKSVIEWARETKEFVASLVEKKFPQATTPPDKWGAAIASVGMLILIDSVVTTVPEEDRFQTFLGVAKDMQMYILNGVDLTKFTIPTEFQDL